MTTKKRFVMESTTNFIIALQSSIKYFFSLVQIYIFEQTMSWADDKSGNISVTAEQDAVYCGKDGEQGNAIYSKGGNGSWQFKVCRSSK